VKKERKSLLRSESGQALIMTSLCMVCLMGFLGLVVDVGLLFRDRVNLQKVADAAARAGASEIQSGNYQAAAIDSAAQNGVVNGTNGTVTVTLGTTYHPSAVKVYVSQPETTHFMPVLGFGTVTVGATAAAGIATGQVCMYALDTPTSAPKGYGIIINGGGNQDGIHAPQCDVYDNADLELNGSAQLITDASTGVAGTLKGNGTASPPPVQNLLPVPDPLGNYWTVPSCSGAVNTINISSGSVNPGCYKDFNVSGTAQFQAGLYVIRGNLNLTSTTSASGVTFYVDSAHGGTLSCPPSKCAFLAPVTAPPLGTGTTGSCSFASGCNGLLFWDTETTNFPKTVNIGSVSLTGIIYAPNATLTMGGSTTLTLDSNVVAGAYVLNGDVNLTNYSAGAGAASPFNSAALME
jgi:Flp pilus assembly protein TadG